MLLFTTFILVFSAFPNAFGSELCHKEQWFNDLTGKCQQCRTCSGDSKEMFPCQEFSDTMCMDTKEIRRMIVDMDPGKAGVRPRSWHEMEGPDHNSAGAVMIAKDGMTAKEYFDSVEGMWSQIILVILSVAFIFMLSAIVLMVLRYFGKIGNRNGEPRKSSHRARLFSRDRLNTTEYMNNLATLDRRLAIDEILEKRKRAIFEPQLLVSENPYADDVFVDISGLPRTTRTPSNDPGTTRHDYEELDHRKCLLQLKDQQ